MPYMSLFPTIMMIYLLFLKNRVCYFNKTQSRMGKPTSFFPFQAPTGALDVSLQSKQNLISSGTH